MLATMCYMQSGTPFIYQGQEIGMLNNHLDSIDKFKDVVTFNNQRLFKKFGFSDKKYLEIANKTSRENARTPVQWDSSEYGGLYGRAVVRRKSQLHRNKRGTAGEGP